MDYNDQLAAVISRVAKTGYENQPRDENDFRGSDGLLRCAKCGEKKETIVCIGKDSPTERKMRVPCICRCIREQQEAEKRKQQEEEDMRRIARLRELSLMDEKFRSAYFQKCQVTQYNSKNIGLCKRYAETFERFLKDNQGLLFWGEVGTGKSFAAACIANELLNRGIPVIMTSFVKLLEQFQKGNEAETDIINRLNSARLVIFDDLGAERNTDYALEKVYNIVDSRYRAGLPMLLTTNLNLQDMLSEEDIRYKRIYDRIFEVCYPMEFKGPSWRKKVASSRFEEMERLLNG